MNARRPTPPAAEPRIARSSASAAWRAPAGALGAFARGELPLGHRPPEAPAGRGVRVFVIEYGGNPADPHVRRGRGAAGDAACRGDVASGTAISALIRLVAPAAEVFTVKILRQGVSTTTDVLEGALEFAVRSSARVVNLRVPLPQAGRGGHVAMLCRRAAQLGAILVGAARDRPARGARSAVPAEVIGAIADTRLAERSMRYVRGAPFECRAAGRPPLQGTPAQARDAAGHGFAAARVSGVVACILEAHPRADLEDVRSELERHFSCRPHPRKEEAR